MATLPTTRTRSVAVALKSPLSNEEGAKRTGGRDVLVSRQTRLSQQIAGMHAGLEAIALRPPEPVHDLHAWTHQRFRMQRRLDRDEGVRLDVLAELELRRAQKVADICLHVGGCDCEQMCAKRAGRASCDLVGGNAER